MHRLAMEEDEGTGRVATNPIKLILAPKTSREPDPRISRCKHPENHTSIIFLGRSRLEPISRLEPDLI